MNIVAPTRICTYKSAAILYCNCPSVGPSWHWRGIGWYFFIFHEGLYPGTASRVLDGKAACVCLVALFAVAPPLCFSLRPPSVPTCTESSHSRFPIVLAGGALLDDSAPRLSQMLSDRLKQMLPHAQLVKPEVRHRPYQSIQMTTRGLIILHEVLFLHFPAVTD